MKNFSIKRIIAEILLTIMVMTSLNFIPVEAAETIEWEYGYTGNVQSFTAPYSGEYKLETWGASGGGAHSKYGGMGGYSYGYVRLQKGETIYLEVGQQGNKNGTATYNGGGAGGNGASSGGGATSITTKNNGELKNYKNDIKSVILVGSGGGGSGANQVYSSLNRENSMTIGNGGGTSSGSVYKYVNVFGVPNATFSHGATVDSGYEFGQGASSDSERGGAGGGGLYGGWNSTGIIDGTSGSIAGGSGGSGYVNPQSYIKIYNGESTSSTNIGNGKAKISYMGTYNVNVDILLNNNGTFKGESGIKLPLTVPCDTEIDFPNALGIDGATFTGYTILDGSTIKIANNKANVGMDNSVVMANFTNDIVLSELETSTTSTIDLKWFDKTSGELEYELYRKNDEKDWYQIDESGEKVSKPSSTSLNGSSLTSLTIPMSGVYKIELWGQKGTAVNSGSRSGKAGNGSYVNGYVKLQAGQTLTTTTYQGGAGYGGSPMYGGRGGQGIGVLLDGTVILAAGGGAGTTSAMWCNNTEWHGSPVSTNVIKGNNSSTTGSNGTLSPRVYLACDGGQVSGAGGGGGGYPYGGYVERTTGWCNARAYAGMSYGNTEYVYTSQDLTKVGANITAGGSENTSVVAKITPIEVSAKFDVTTLKNIPLIDTAKPDAPTSNSFESKNSKLEVTWNESTDNGTNNAFQAKSFYSGKEEILHNSQVISKMYVSGVVGYYYKVDENPTTTITANNGTKTTTNTVIINVPLTESYMHVAAIDAKGNISDTCSFELPSTSNNSAAKYTVKHFKETLDGEYELADTEIGNAIVGTYITPATKTYTGFTSPKKDSIMVQENGNTEIDYIYTRNSYTVTLFNGSGISSVTGAKTYKYGQTVKISATVERGYSWKNWSGTYNSTNNNFSFSMPSNNVSLTANASINSYNLTVNPNGGTYNGITSPSTYLINYKGTQIIESPVAPTGYLFSEWVLDGDGATMSNLSTRATFSMGYSNATLTATYIENKFNVTYIDVENSINGTELGRQVVPKTYNSKVNGADIGSSTADNAYYYGYYLYDTTETVVNLSGATVYRIFKLRTINITGTVNWIDNSNKWSTRPNEVTISLYRDGTNVDSTKGLVSSDSNNYSFNNVPKYSTSDGHVYNYTVSQSEVISKTYPEDKYTTTQNTYNFINNLGNTDTETENKGLTVKGSIYWEDKGDTLGYRPKTVTITLYQNNVEYKTLEVDSFNDNTYEFSKLPKYDSNLNKYSYTVKETVIANYLINGEIKDAYTIKADTPNMLDFTNVFNTTNSSPVPVKPDHENTVTVKTNTDDMITISLKGMETIINSDLSISYSDSYNGQVYNLSANNIGTVLSKMNSGKYEIDYFTTDYILNDITCNGDNNIWIEGKNEKYYLVIKDTNVDVSGTITLNFSKKDHIGYQTYVDASNYFKVRVDTASLLTLESEVYAISDMIIEAEDAYTIIYNNSDTIDENIYNEGDEVEVLDYQGELPENKEFLGWSLSKNVEKPDYFVGDVIPIKDMNISLYPVFTDIEEESSKIETTEEISSEEETPESEENSTEKDTSSTEEESSETIEDFRLEK